MSARFAESRYGFWVQLSKRVLSDPGGAVGGAILCLAVIMALGAPVLSPRDPYEVDTARKLQPPSREFLCGTDEVGRDILSRVVFGARISLSVVVAATALAICMGVPAGLVAGYFGGLVETVVMRIVDIALSFPAILIGMMTIAAVGASSTGVALAIALYGIPSFARMARAMTLAEKEKDYVMAAKSLGASSQRIVLRHVLPNAVPPLLVQTTVSLSLAILLEAAFSFLGLGSQPPEPSWGVMLQRARLYLSYSVWYALFPGLAITMIILATNLLAGSLQDALKGGSQR